MLPQVLIPALRTQIELSAASLALALVVGLPLGIAAAEVPPVRGLLLGMAGSLRALPSLAVLTLALPLLGLGAPAAIAALTLLALPPVVSHCEAGLRAIPGPLIDAARGLGLTQPQIVARVRWPLALPVTLAGVRTAAMEVVASATLATFVGAGGLGDPIVQGLQTGNDALLLAACLTVALLAFAVEAAFAVTATMLGARRR